MFIVKITAKDPILPPFRMVMREQMDYDDRDRRVWYKYFKLDASYREQAHVLKRMVEAEGLKTGVSIRSTQVFEEGTTDYKLRDQWDMPIHDITYVLQKAQVYLRNNFIYKNGLFDVFKETLLGQRRNFALVDAPIAHAGWVQLIRVTLLKDGLGASGNGAVWLTQDAFDNVHYMATINNQMVDECLGFIDDYTGRMICKADWTVMASRLIDQC